VGLAHQCKPGRRSRRDPDRHRCGFGVFAIMPFRDPIDKRSSARLFRDRDYARAQANAGSEPRDPSWWSAVLATRAAFAARPGAKLISVPLHGGSLSVSVGGGWRTSTSLPDDVAVQLDLYLPYCVSHPRGLVVAHIWTAELRPRTANPAGSPARPTSCIATACGRSPTLSSSAPAPCGPMTRS
jgi:hypothetical protein